MRHQMLFNFPLLAAFMVAHLGEAIAVQMPVVLLKKGRGNHKMRNRFDCSGWEETRAFEAWFEGEWAGLAGAVWFEGTASMDEETVVTLAEVEATIMAELVIASGLMSPNPDQMGRLLGKSA